MTPWIPITPSTSATLAAITIRTMVNAIYSDARSRIIAPSGGTIFTTRAANIGMYIFGTGVGSARARVDVFATTPTIVSQPNAPENDGFSESHPLPDRILIGE